MADIEKTVYRLYALPLTLENIKVAAQKRFSRATPTPAPGYVLIYTEEEQPEGSKEITKDQINLLSPADEQWLFDSNAVLIAEQIEKKQPEILKGLADSIEALEAELKRQKEAFDMKGA